MSPRISHLDNSQEQCRQCTSFADYMRENKKKFEKLQQEQDVCMPEDAPQRRTDCPLDKDELGNKTWSLLHTIAAKYPNEPTTEVQKDMCAFITVFSRFYPCEHCAADFRTDLRQHPPRLQSQRELSQWLCEAHNRVNVKIGKPIFDCSNVDQRWRDGWKDGSCDV